MEANYPYSKPLTAEEEAKAWAAGETDRVIQSNVGLVRRNAKRYKTPLLDDEDLVQEAMLCMYGLVDRFDPDNGCRFFNFAWPFVQVAMFNLARKSEPGNVLSRDLKRMQLRLQRFEDELLSKTGHAPAVEDVAASLGYSEQQVTRLRGSSDSTDPDSFATDDPTPELDAAIDREELSLGAVPFLLATLTDRQRTVIERLYGLDGEDPVTADRLASSLGVADSTVADEREAAMASLRHLDKMQTVLGHLDGDFRPADLAA